jgi:hypothetical protein
MSVLRRPLIVRSLSVGSLATLAVVVLAAGFASASGGGSGNGNGAGASKAAGASTKGLPSPSCVPQTLNVSAALAGGRVTVSPGPGVRDASTATQLSFLGGAGGNADFDLSHVVVRGSRSGTHAGSLRAYSEGDGASFVPAKPFTPGELVTVHAVLGEEGRSTPFAWSFTVAVPDNPGAEDVTESTRLSSATAPAPAPKEYQSFHSLPELRPPDVTVSSTARTATGGDLFLAPYSGIGQYGPMILGEHGELVWFKSLSPAGTRAANLRVQEYEGKPALTWWQDPLDADGSTSAGEVIDNSAYQTIAILRAGNGYQPDLHEFQITPQGTAWITVYDAIDCNLSSVGGPKEGAIADTLLQEIDLKTGLVMYEWHSLDHVPLRESYAPVEANWDFFHINSVDLDNDGNLLVSSRSMQTIYKLDRAGRILWRLGGKSSDFEIGPGANFAWQHDARRQPDGTFTVFDNGATPVVEKLSRGLILDVDERAMTSTLLHQYTHPKILAASQGSVQLLENGNVFVGWGEIPHVSEFHLSGQMVFDAELGDKYESYRAFRLPWSGLPAEAPALATARDGAELTAYASWNGATGVERWQLLAGAQADALRPVASTGSRGFESALQATVAPGQYIAVQALDAGGAPLGQSRTVTV